MNKLIKLFKRKKELRPNIRICFQLLRNNLYKWQKKLISNRIRFEILKNSFNNKNTEDHSFKKINKLNKI